MTVVFAKSVAHVSEPVFIRNEEENFEEYLCFYPKLGHSLPGLSQAQKFLKLKNTYKKLIDSLPARPFDIIHVNTIFPATIPASYAQKKYPDAKLFITEHWSGYYPEDGNYKGALLIRSTKQLVAKARAVLVISQKLEKAMKAHGLKNNYRLIHNTVDTTLFRPDGRHRRQDKTLRILHVSSLTEREKNISGIIAVMALLKERQFDFHLTIIGSNAAEEDDHKKRVAEHNLGRHITFSGYKNPDEIADCMSRSDVFLLFSHFEGAPVVIAEALSCGLPVISTGVGQVAQMIPQGMGAVLKNADPGECADVLMHYNIPDFAGKAAMHRHANERYSPEAVCREISSCYNLYS